LFLTKQYFIQYIMKSKNAILEKTFSFSLKIIQYVELLEKHKKFVVANQLLK